VGAILFDRFGYTVYTGEYNRQPEDIPV